MQLIVKQNEKESIAQDKTISTHSIHSLTVFFLLSTDTIRNFRIQILGVHQMGGFFGWPMGGLWVGLGKREEKNYDRAFDLLT